MPTSGRTDFDRRARDYEAGPRAKWHHAVVLRAVETAVTALPVPLRVLDIGCGTGAYLRELTARLPNAADLVGVDPSLEMLRLARERAEGFETFARAEAEGLPFPDASFDLVVTTTSFDHWGDQAAGICEAARVLTKDGRFVLADLCASWLSDSKDPDRARTVKRVRALMLQAGLEVERVQTIYRVAGLPLIRAFVGAHAQPLPGPAD